MTRAIDVTAPRSSWRLKRHDELGIAVGPILIDGNDQEDADSLALGLWEGEPRLASRWDRSSTNDKGNPNSSGYATWYVVPRWMEVGILSVANIPADVRIAALRFLAQPRADQ